MPNIEFVTFDARGGFGRKSSLQASLDTVARLKPLADVIFIPNFAYGFKNNTPSRNTPAYNRDGLLGELGYECVTSEHELLFSPYPNERRVIASLIHKSFRDAYPYSGVTAEPHAGSYHVIKHNFTSWASIIGVALDPRNNNQGSATLLELCRNSGPDRPKELSVPRIIVGHTAYVSPEQIETARDIAREFADLSIDGRCDNADYLDALAQSPPPAIYDEYGFSEPEGSPIPTERFRGRELQTLRFLASHHFQATEGPYQISEVTGLDWLENGTRPIKATVTLPD